MLHFLYTIQYIKARLWQAVETNYLPQLFQNFIVVFRTFNQHLPTSSLVMIAVVIGKRKKNQRQHYYSHIRLFRTDYYSWDVNLVANIILNHRFITLQHMRTSEKGSPHIFQIYLIDINTLEQECEFNDVSSFYEDLVVSKRQMQNNYYLMWNMFYDDVNGL